MSDQEKLSPEVEKEIKARARKIVLGLVGVTAELRAQRLGGREDVWTAVFNWLSQNNGAVSVGAGLRTLRNEMRK